MNRDKGDQGMDQERLFGTGRLLAGLRHPPSSREGVLSYLVLPLAVVTVIFLALPALGLTPPGQWSCFEGEPQINGYSGKCWAHWAFAEHGWHHTAEVPSVARPAIAAGIQTWENSHPDLNAYYDSASPSHTYWKPDSFWTQYGMTPTPEADATEVLDSNGNPHLVTLSVTFPASWNWNYNTSSGHGTFSGVDLLSIATHEWGHVVGLGHSTQGNGHYNMSSSVVDNSITTMSASSAPLVGGHTEQRSLHGWDITGLCTIYEQAHSGYSC